MVDYAGIARLGSVFADSGPCSEVMRMPVSAAIKDIPSASSRMSLGHGRSFVLFHRDRRLHDVLYFLKASPPISRDEACCILSLMALLLRDWVERSPGQTLTSMLADPGMTASLCTALGDMLRPFQSGELTGTPSGSLAVYQVNHFPRVAEGEVEEERLIGDEAAEIAWELEEKERRRRRNAARMQLPSNSSSSHSGLVGPTGAVARQNSEHSQMQTASESEYLPFGQEDSTCQPGKAPWEQPSSAGIGDNASASEHGYMGGIGFSIPTDEIVSKIRSGEVAQNVVCAATMITSTALPAQRREGLSAELVLQGLTAGISADVLADTIFGPETAGTQPHAAAFWAASSAQPGDMRRGDGVGERNARSSSMYSSDLPRRGGVRDDHRGEKGRVNGGLEGAASAACQLSQDPAAEQPGCGARWQAQRSRLGMENPPLSQDAVGAELRKEASSTAGGKHEGKEGSIQGRRRPERTLTPRERLMIEIAEMNGEMDPARTPSTSSSSHSSSPLFPLLPGMALLTPNDVPSPACWQPGGPSGSSPCVLRGSHAGEERQRGIHTPKSAVAQSQQHSDRRWLMRTATGEAERTLSARGMPGRPIQGPQGAEPPSATCSAAIPSAAGAIASASEYDHRGQWSRFPTSSGCPDTFCSSWLGRAASGESAGRQSPESEAESILRCKEEVRGMLVSSVSEKLLRGSLPPSDSPRVRPASSANENERVVWTEYRSISCRFVQRSRAGLQISLPDGDPASPASSDSSQRSAAAVIGRPRSLLAATASPRAQKPGARATSKAPRQPAFPDLQEDRVAAAGPTVLIPARGGSGRFTVTDGATEMFPGEVARAESARCRSSHPWSRDRLQQGPAHAAVRGKEKDGDAGVWDSYLGLNGKGLCPVAVQQHSSGGLRQDGSQSRALDPRGCAAGSDAPLQDSMSAQLQRSFCHFGDAKQEPFAATNAGPCSGRQCAAAGVQLGGPDGVCHGGRQAGPWLACEGDATEQPCESKPRRQSFVVVRSTAVEAPRPQRRSFTAVRNSLNDAALPAWMRAGDEAGESVVVKQVAASTESGLLNMGAVVDDSEGAKRGGGKRFGLLRSRKSAAWRLLDRLALRREVSRPAS